MTDYAALDNQALNRLIAERYWRLEEFISVGIKWYRVFDHYGEPVLRHIAYSNLNEWPEYELDLAYPRFSDDLNAAMILWSEEDLDVEIRYFSILNKWKVNDGEYVDLNRLAREVSIVWLTQLDKRQ